MKKVAILKSRLTPNGGGLEKYTMRLAQAFAQKGCQVTILTSHSQVKGSHAFDIVNLEAKSKIAFRHLWQFDHQCQEWIKANAPDVVFGMDRNTCQSHYRAGNGVHAEFLRKRLSTDSFFKRLSFRINPLHLSILKMERSTYESPDLETLFTNSNMVKEEILHHYNVDPKKIRVVHNGVEWHEMRSAFDASPHQRVEILHQLRLNPSVFQFLFVGKGFRRKGLQYLLKALSQIRDRNFQLSVVGHDKEMPAFKAMAETLGIGRQVKFFGHRNDVIEFYKACDVLVIPSTYDPFANVTIEALAMGLYVVSSKSNGASEIITPEIGTVIEDLHSEESFLKAIKEALNHPKTLSRARQIRESVVTFDFHSQLDKIVNTTLEG